MNEQEYFIGQLLNDESRRLTLAQDIQLDKIFSEDLKIIVLALQEKEFSFMNLKKHGIDIVCLAMDLANNAMKKQLNNKGMLWRQSSSY